MKLILLLLAAYFALASGCYLPFNDARFTNRTLWDEDRTTVDRGSDAWLTIIGGNNPVQPWPKDSNHGSGLALIQFCYLN